MIEDLDLITVSDRVLVINKASGLHSVSREEGDESLASRIAERFPECMTASPNPADCGLANRLDFDTTGLVLCARDREAWDVLHEAFTSGQNQKFYLCIADHHMVSPHDLSAAIGSPYRRSSKVRVYPHHTRVTRTLPAHSHFTPLRYFKRHSCTSLLVHARTGRRHQIRAHAAFLGHPLVGDALYGSTRSLQDVVADAPGRFCLHAYAMTLCPRITELLGQDSLLAPVPRCYDPFFAESEIMNLLSDR
jgi:23S rRNA-/tRNA-specific pseudouridylate synthase